MSSPAVPAYFMVALTVMAAAACSAEPRGEPEETTMESTEGGGDPEAIRPFRIEVSDEVLTDLRDRLARARLPDQIPGTGWDYGTNRAYLEELLAYWEEDFDWRAQERRLNEFDHFKTTIDGLDLHFIHQRSPQENAIPLILTHGWPGSFIEFAELIGPLTDPVSHGADLTDSFHIIAPSLPGFGFSGIPTEPGYSPEKIAHLLAALMEKIGYQRYAIAGGDWGAIINRYLANNYPDRLIGLHSNMMLDPAMKKTHEKLSELNKTHGPGTEGDVAP